VKKGEENSYQKGETEHTVEKEEKFAGVENAIWKNDGEIFATCIGRGEE